MNSHKIETLIIKYVTKSISASELETLSKWIEDSKNEELFRKYVKLNYAIDFNMYEFDTNKSKKALLNHIQRKKTIFRYIKFNSILKYAAVFLVALGVIYFYQNSKTSFQKTIISEDAITIKLDDGSIEVMDEKGNKTIVDKDGNLVGVQKGDKLNYQNLINSQSANSTTQTIHKLTYNELTIPYGKKFQITLSDGTIVYLNSGSSIKYPINFYTDENLERHVYLTNGEAYFEVKKDNEHPFIVSTSDMDIKVLGTEFNISAYPEDATISTVLVNGSINIKGNKDENKGLRTILKPGFKADWAKNKTDLNIQKVDTSIYTEWRNGKLIFNNIQFKNILIKLERRYNTTIINHNKKLDEQFFDATFDIESIEDVLNSFNKSFNFDYTIKNNKIIIN